MRNTSVLKWLLVPAFCLVWGTSAQASSLENLGKAVVEKYEEKSTPLFSEQEPEVKEKLKGDPFFDKIREKNKEFTKDEQETRRKFIEKVREKDWSNEEKQEKLAAFQKKELARRKKFMDKQQKKIQDHQEGDSSIWKELF